MQSFLVRFCVEQDTDGSYFGYCPQLKGCIADGKTLEELQKNLEDAVILYLDSMMHHNEEVPTGEYIIPIEPKPTRQSPKRSQYLCHSSRTVEELVVSV